MFAGLISFFISPVGKIVGLIIIASLILGSVYVKGHHDGAVSVQAKWDAAIKKETEQANEDRKNVEHDVCTTPGCLRDNDWNRDGR